MPIIIYSMAMQKRCNTCELVKDSHEFYDRNRGVGPVRLEHVCRACQVDKRNRVNADKRARGELNKPRVTKKSPEQARIANLRYMFRMGPEDYLRILAAQAGGCAICGLPEPEPFLLGVDHDHTCCDAKNPSGSYRRTCGRCVRGLLCQPCNTGLGLWRDNKDRLASAIAYLDTWEARRG